ncbi:toll-like receptor Tollo [Anopheles cruzii]|uniref:toll-like receptor Tollo n=1 Tax=Anopheles cruzii TaxID=68878 RepID=UPI0022EC99A2|nr:toll-like receptor Tollo [Anopheles cruzii]
MLKLTVLWWCIFSGAAAALRCASEESSSRWASGEDELPPRCHRKPFDVYLQIGPERSGVNRPRKTYREPGMLFTTVPPDRPQCSGHCEKCSFQFDSDGSVCGLRCERCWTALVTTEGDRSKSELQIGRSGKHLTTSSTINPTTVSSATESVLTPAPVNEQEEMVGGSANDSWPNVLSELMATEIQMAHLLLSKKPLQSALAALQDRLRPIFAGASQALADAFASEAATNLATALNLTSTELPPTTTSHQLNLGGQQLWFNGVLKSLNFTIVCSLSLSLSLLLSRPVAAKALLLGAWCCRSVDGGRGSILRHDEAAGQQHQQQQQQLPKACAWTGAVLEAPSQEGGRSDELACRVKTIGRTEGLLANLSSYQIDRIKSLRLECSDILFFESSLDSSSAPSGPSSGSSLATSTSTSANGAGLFLGSFPGLLQLSIDHCKIKYIPALAFSTLRVLRSLSLSTRNVHWSTMNLELHPNSFRGLAELKELQLAESNIWALPADVLCPLHKLRSLNLTGNRLSDLTQLGLSDWGKGPTAPGKACNTGLEVLDLSGNDLTLLPDNGLSALRSLNALHLQRNLLKEIADRAFVGLGTLEVLNLADNKLTALTPELFVSSRKIRQVYLQNNSLAVLAPGVFEGLDRLESLDLSHNQLTSVWVKRDTFAGQVRLVVLSLGHNQLSKVDQHVFRGLYSLQILNLEHNAIELIADGAFADLKNLHALFLSHNRLRQIEPYHFSELYVLHQLILESNQIAYIHERAFENLTHLHDLSLNDNRLEEIPLGMKSLKFLQSLDVGKNQIAEINNSSFEGLEELMGLRLVDNQIREIARDTFFALSTIHVLNLASNRIRHIDQSAFSSNPTLRAIRLDANELEDISGVFTSLPALVYLNISDNRIAWFDYSHYPHSLEWLDIHKNNITELGNRYDVGTWFLLKMLDVSHNALRRINASSFPQNIETILLNNNELEEIAPETFTGKVNIVKVVLYGNRLRRIEMASLALTPMPDTRVLPEFYLGDNLIHCDCSMEWLQRINELAYLRQYPQVKDLDTVQCTMEHGRGEQRRPLMAMRASEFLCRYDSHCFATCHCCDFDACDCKMACPDRCSCYHDTAWESNIVDCGAVGLSLVPAKIPMDATDIYLDGNNLGALGSHVFIGKKKLKALFLNGSRIESLNNKTFAGIPALEVLHLESNGLEVLSGAEFEQLRDLRALYLHANALAAIGNKSFVYQKSLEVLTLDDNRLAELRPWELLPTLTPDADGAGSGVTLGGGGNRLDCGCDTMPRLLDWLDRQFRNVSRTDPPLGELRCSKRDIPLVEAIGVCEAARGGSSRPVGSLSGVPVATPTVQRTIIDDDFIDYLPLLIAVLAGLLLTVLLVTLVLLFRQDVCLWAHARYGVRLCKDPLSALERCEDSEKLYDAYFVYSAADADLVSGPIGQELEHHGYGMCLHYRDVHGTTSFLGDSMQSAADASRKLILFVSVKFLQLEWSQPEFRAALQAVLELIRPSRRKQRLILITSVPGAMLSMDPIMDILARTCTVIAWDDRRFWDKVRFAMPDLGKGDPLGKGAHRKNINIRYTPAPTNNLMVGPAPSAPSATTWPKRLNSEVCIQGGQQQLHHQQPYPVPLPRTHQGQATSTYHTDEDDPSTAGSSPQYEAPGGSAGFPLGHHLHHHHHHHQLHPGTVPYQHSGGGGGPHIPSSQSNSPHLPQTMPHHHHHHHHHHQQQQQQQQHHHQPLGYGGAGTLPGHVYSTIPESQYNQSTHSSSSIGGGQQQQQQQGKQPLQHLPVAPPTGSSRLLPPAGGGDQTGNRPYFV